MKNFQTSCLLLIISSSSWTKTFHGIGFPLNCLPLVPDDILVHCTVLMNIVLGRYQNHDLILMFYIMP